MEENIWMIKVDHSSQRIFICHVDTWELEVDQSLVSAIDEK